MTGGIKANTMQEIFEGIDKFQTKLFPYLEKRFKQLACKQQPHTLFITCCDSRVVPSAITLTEPGELFVCRTIGNIVPVHGSEDKSVASAIEYAVNALEVSNIIVCGHSDCGAMKGLLHPEKLESLPDTSAWLKHAEKTRQSLVNSTSVYSQGDLLTSLIEANVLAQLENLKTHPAVAAKMPNLCGLVYDIGSGSIREVQRRNLFLEKGAA
jgi:carbonic anhydrase